MFIGIMITVCVGCGIIAAAWNVHDRKTAERETILTAVSEITEQKAA